MAGQTSGQIVTQSLWGDLLGGLRSFPLWYFMAHRELKLRYARSFLGPIWITLTMAFWVGGLTLLYGGLFGAPLEEIAPFITLGVIAWNFLTAVMVEGCTSLITARGYLLQSPVALSTFTWLVFYRNLLILMHNMTVFVILMVVFQLWPNVNWLWALVGWPILFIAGFGLALLFSITAARFRDIAPLVSSIMTIGFFLTPVMWRPSDLVKNQFIATWNPFTHLLEVFRAPLLGVAPSELSLLAATGISLFLLLSSLWALAASKRQLIFWL